MKVWEGKQVVVSYYLQQQQEDDIEEERNETLHQTKLSSIIIYLVRLHYNALTLASFDHMPCSEVVKCWHICPECIAL